MIDVILRETARGGSREERVVSISQEILGQNLDFKPRVCRITWFIYRGVAQPGSAPALGAGGRKFKSSRPDQIYSQQ
jgi:hypothetical protein